MSSSGTIGNRVADKVTVVTGASSGVGRAIALAFAAQGAKLVLCADLRPDPRGGFGAVEATTPTHELICQKYGEDKAVFLKTDVTVGTQVDATVQEAVRLGGRLDVNSITNGSQCFHFTSADETLGGFRMINNAGTGGTESAGKVHEMSDESWDFVMNINTRSVFLGCRAACAQFLKQDLHPSGDRGWIINTASMLGLVGLKPGAAAYCASKGAVVLLTKQVAVEYGSDRIHCNALCPGYLKTPMTQPIFADDKTRETIIAATPWGEWGNAEDVAKCAVFLASDDAAYVTGLPMVIDGGYTAQ